MKFQRNPEGITGGSPLGGKPPREIPSVRGGNEPLPPLKRLKPDRYPTDATLKTYGLRRVRYEAIAAFQGHRCAICRMPFGEAPGAIDHEHATGRVRGLLCRACNMGLGCFRDNAEALVNAVRYLTETPVEQWLDGELRAEIFAGSRQAEAAR